MLLVIDLCLFGSIQCLVLLPLSSYSSGESYLWPLMAGECEDGPGRLERMPGKFESAVPTCAAVNSHLGIVGTSKGQNIW